MTPSILDNRPSALPEAERATRHARIVVTQYGGPEELQLVEERRPEPKEGEVRVKVLAAGPHTSSATQRKFDASF